MMKTTNLTSFSDFNLTSTTGAQFRCIGFSLFRRVPMKKSVQFFLAMSAIIAIFALLPPTTSAQTYVGSDKCKLCHDNVNATLGYNIYQEYTKTGHPYKLNEVKGGPPSYPAGTGPEVLNPPPGTTWDDYAYVIGGYGWKARFIKKNGKIYTETDQVQYNLASKTWVAYNKGQDMSYNFACFTCHTTGGSATGSWNAQTPDLGTFTEPGIRCEGCHGPGSDHMANPTSVKPPITGRNLTYERCGDCHQRGGKTASIPAKGGYVEHHEQFNEMQASKHGQGGSMTCGTCHDTHIALLYPAVAAAGTKALKVQCETCHTNKAITINGKVKNIECMDCHMAKSAKSAVAVQKGSGFRGDVSSHLWKINTNPIDKTAGMFTSDGLKVLLDTDNRGAITLDFACLSCHDSETLEWASNYAKNIHDGITTDARFVSKVPTQVELLQNYPNPFNPATRIEYQLPKLAHVQIDVIDPTGHTVETLVDAVKTAGSHHVRFDGARYPSGMYLYRITTGSTVITRKMALIK